MDGGDAKSANTIIKQPISMETGVVYISVLDIKVSIYNNKKEKVAAEKKHCNQKSQGHKLGNRKKKRKRENLSIMKMVQEENIRKGPWTEQEDFNLVCFVGLFGDRRWDFIAKVSGLNRTGKSCRLRWVNYLHPGLKRGKMTPQEERLVLELHSKWGNRWSRIARKLPGRTDNEIKNYWRTHMRKKAQEKKRAASPSSSSSNCSSSSNITSTEGGASFYDTGGLEIKASSGAKKTGGDHQEQEDDKKRDQKEYSLDDIWKDINLPEVNSIEPVYNGYSEEACNIISCPLMASPAPWEYCSDSLWKMDEEESKMFLPTTSDQFLSCFEYGKASLTG